MLEKECVQLIVLDAVPQPDDRLDAVEAGWEAGKHDCGDHGLGWCGVKLGDAAYNVVDVVEVCVEVRAGLHLQRIEVIVVPHEL